MSIVMLFLLVLSAAKIGPRSQNRSSVCGTPPTRRSAVGPGRGFEVDHLRSEEREHVARERTRPRRTSCPARAAPGTEARVSPRRCGCPCARVGATASIECSPSRGAGSGVRRRPAPSRKGGRGFTEPSRGFATNDSRARKCSIVVRFAPLAIGALGIRKADARSSTSATVRSATQASIVGASAVRSRKSL